VSRFHLDMQQSDYTRSCINTIVLLRMSIQGCSKQVEVSNKYVIEEKTVRQVGYTAFEM
jgi:hypothetical protein